MHWRRTTSFALNKAHGGHLLKLAVMTLFSGKRNKDRNFRKRQVDDNDEDEGITNTAKVNGGNFVNSNFNKL